MKLIDNKHSRMLSNALDAYSLRQKAIASNIANVDSPGYRKLEVDFEDSLNRAQQNLNGKHIDEVHARMGEGEGKVVLEDEMMKLADNQIRVSLVTKELRHHFSMLRTAVTGRPQGS